MADVPNQRILLPDEGTGRGCQSMCCQLRSNGPRSRRKLKANCNEMDIECAAATTFTCYRSLHKVTDGQVIVRSVVMSLIYEL